MLADLLAAARYLRRSPVHVLVITLSLGIGLLPNLSPFDPIAILAPCGLPFAVGLLASALPAYRAATVDPIDVLRGRDV